MKLSVITICRNESRRIIKTIQSVIRQTFKDFQYIVIDGASIDGTVEIIKKYINNIDMFISEPDSGIYNAMNKGINYCKGEFVYFLNGGDTFFADTTLEKIFTYGLSGDLIYGNIGIHEITGEQRILKMPAKLTKKFLLKKTIPHQSTFTRKTLFELIGKYDEKYKIAADYKFSLQVIFNLKSKVQYIPETFAWFDRSGIGFLNPQARDNEKEQIRMEIFGTPKKIEA